jgi:hypothetical protein
MYWNRYDPMYRSSHIQIDTILETYHKSPWPIGTQVLSQTDVQFSESVL